MHERAIDEPRRPDLESLGLLPAKLRNPLRGRDIVQLEIPCALHVADPECHHLRKLPRFPLWVYWVATWSQCMPRLGAQLHALRRSVTSTVPATTDAVRHRLARTDDVWAVGPTGIQAHYEPR